MSNEDTEVIDLSDTPNRAVSTRKSQYELMPVLRDPEVDPGGEVRIDMYVSGYGPITRNKLTVMHSIPQLIDSEDPGEFIAAIGSDEEGTIWAGEYAFEHDAASSLTMDESGTTIDLAEILFMDDPYWIEEVDTIQGAFPRIRFESTYGKHPAMRMEFNVDNRAEPGDYEIPMVLTYGNEIGMEQSQSIVSVHVTAWRERHELLLGGAAVLATLIALVSLLWQTGFPQYLSDIII